MPNANSYGRSSLIAAIIVEYNPLHNGHIYHINQTKKILNELAPNEENSLIAIMSGNFTQRGDIAVLNKFTRAMHAIMSGVDVVVELPAIYATSSAEYFAKGAIQVAKKINNLGLIVFGAECDDIYVLSEVAQITTTSDYDNILKEHLKSGLSYTLSSEQAIQKLSKIDPKIAFSPNNMLAIEYLKQAKIANLGAKLVAIKRIGSEYNQTELHCEYNSASGIRQAIASGNYDFDSLKLPQYVFDDLKNSQVDYEKLFAIVANNCLTITDVYEDNEGIINRIKKFSQIANSYDELVDMVHTKRYTKSKIKRVLLHTALQHTFNDLSSECNLNVLAVNENKRHLLSFLDSTDNAKSQVQNEYADKIYNIVSSDKITTNKLRIIK